HIENLDLVTPQQEDAAVAPRLPLLLGEFWDPELRMQLDVGAETLRRQQGARAGNDFHRSVLDLPAPRPALRIGPAGEIAAIHEVDPRFWRRWRRLLGRDLRCNL